MYARVKLFSNTDNAIYNFLTSFFKTNEYITSKENLYTDIYLHALEWEFIYANPIDIVDIIGVFIDNSDIFNISMWVCLNNDYFINITNTNANDFIKYLYSRYSY